MGAPDGGEEELATARRQSLKIHVPGLREEAPARGSFFYINFVGGRRGLTGFTDGV